MRDELLEYYEKELSFLRRTGAEFANRYPKIASRLLLEPTKCDDPHVERLLEGFAFLAAHVHLKLADDFSEINEALLNIVYPHYTRPLPAMSMVEFQLDPEQGKLTSGLRIPRETVLYSRPVGGAVCKFRTCYDTTLWPLRVTGAKWLAPHELDPPVRSATASAAIRLELECLPDVSFDKLELDTLRLNLSADANLASTLYEVLFNNCTDILFRDPSKKERKEPIRMPGSALQPAGFGEDEGMLPYSRRSFVGYRLLQEYFAFPDKFFFLDLSGFDRVRESMGGSRLEVVFLISSFERSERRSMLEAGVTKETFRLGCTPTINLFPQTSEPILLNQKQYEYVIVPDARRRESMGIFSVEEVVGVTPGSREPVHFEPLYSFRHDSGSDTQLYWYANREPATWGTDRSSDVWLSFVDANGQLVNPDLDSATTRLICYNGDLPSRLPFGDPNGDFEMPGGGPIAKIVTVIKPTQVIQPPLGQPLMWRLISLLSLNYVSLIEGGPEALQELLRLHNFSGSPAGEKQIQGIVAVTGGSTHARIESEQGLAFARGHRVEIEFDEDRFAGGGVYLLASVLERFLALFVSLNSFCILAARTQQRKQPLKEWPPRSGWKTLI